MKKFLPLSLSLLILQNAFSQSHEWFREDFSDNHRNWLVVDDAHTKSYVEKGKYVMQSKEPGNTWGFYSPYIYFDHEMDFVIESNISQVSGDDKAGYGLIWGASDINNGFKFNISSDGTYKIVMRKNGNLKELKPTEKSTAIKPVGQVNNLKIERKGKDLVFLINDQKVHSMPFQPFMGDLFGWNMDSKMVVEVEDISIKQDKQINLVPNLPTGLKKENLGTNINSTYSEGTPVISPDGKTLYFSIEGDPQNIGGAEDGDDIYFATLNNDGSWSAKQHLGEPLNNHDPNYVISVSPDNNSLLLAHTYYNDGSTKGDGFSISHHTAKGWSVPEEIKIKNYYNKGTSTTAFLSDDEEIILLSVKRDDSFGDVDLYVSFRDKKGDWSEPLNLGPVINTNGSEICPYLAPDGKTLYFSSNGHPGYGDNDLFMTKRMDDSWKVWSAPQNLGPEINSPMWDAYFSLPASGKYAYIISNQNSTSGTDIFRVELPEVLQPESVVLLSGKVLNKKTNTPVEATIEFETLPDGKEAGRADSYILNGEYKIILPYGKYYGIHAKAKGFISINEHFDLTVAEKYKEMSKDLLLIPIEPNEQFLLQNVFFTDNSAEIKPESNPELNRLVDAMKENKTMTIEIAGTCTTSPEEKTNRDIAEKRWQAIKNYLIVNGIAEGRITGKSYGASMKTNFIGIKITKK